MINGAVEHLAHQLMRAEQLDNLVMPALRSPCQRRCPRLGVRLQWVRAAFR